MLYLKEIDFTVINPKEKMSLEVKQYLYENLKNGFCFFMTPNDLDTLKVNSKKHKKNYKVGFLYDILGVIYSGMGKEDRHKIISEKYHLWFTYRQFKTLIDEYNENRNKYLLKRVLL